MGIIRLAQYEGRWHSLVGTVTNTEYFSLSEQLLALERDLGSME